MPVNAGGTVDGRYLQTPYHDHIHAQMGWSSVEAWKDSLRDVLALRRIYDELQTEPVLLRKALSLQTFFSQSNPDMVAYLPVPVRKADEVAQRARIDAPVHADLTALLCSENESKSILLVAGSGSGKTVAARKAFHDCIVVPPGASRPPLGDYLPVWISSATPGNFDTIRNCKPAELIERLILNACELGSLTLAGFQCWLEHPRLKLLLFFDLNSWDVEGRSRIAQALVPFLTRYRLDDLPAGHRAVVAYRSSTAIDGPKQVLISSGQFTAYDLDPLTNEQAEHYLRNIRALEQDVYRQVGQRCPERDIDAEVAQLRRLLRRHIGGRPLRHVDSGGGGDAASSVIQTPLLMHFCSSLRGQELANIQTLSDLYERVISRHLERETEQIFAANLDAARRRTEVAMMRLAVLILSRSKDSVAVSTPRFRESLVDPDSGDPREQFIDGDGWWPESEFWHQASWIKWPYVEAEFEQLQEFSLVQRDGEQLRLMHDSFIYYLTARALRSPTPNTVRLRKTWLAPAASQLRVWSGPQQEVAVFLGGMLDREQFEALFVELLSGPADGDTAKLVTALIRGADGRVNTASRLQAEYLRTAGWYGLGEPLAFLPELHAALLTEADGECHELAARLQQRLSQRTWLRTMHGRHRDTNITVRHRSGRVTCVSAWTNPQDSGDLRIVSGCSDGTVELWNPETAEASTIIRHKRSVRSLAVLSDGSVVSGGYDCIIRLWDPRTFFCKTIFVGDGISVNCLAALPDGRFLSGGCDGTVRLCDPQMETFETIIEHESRVTCLTLLPDGSVVSGSADGTVRLCDPQMETFETIIEHEWPVTCLTLLPDGSVVSGSKDKTMRLWDPQIGMAEKIKTDSSVISLAVRPDGCVVSASADKTVRLWDPQQGTLWAPRTQRVETIIEHEGSVSCLTALPDGRVVSGGYDATVRLWGPQKATLWTARTGAMETIIKHENRVACLAVLGDGRVVSGGYDATVRLWDPQTGVIETVVEHERGVSCLVVLPDGRVVSGSFDGKIWVCDPQGGAVQAFVEFDYGVTCSAVLPDGRVALKCDDNTVRLWDPLTGKLQTIIEHEDEATYLAVFPDGRVVSATRSIVRMWNPETADVRTIIKLKQYVTCLAVLPDGRVVLGSSAYGVSLWAPQTEMVETIIEHERPVTCLAVLPDGRVVLGSMDKTVRLWDPVSRSVTAIFATGSTVHCLACSANSSHIYAGLTSGEVLFLQVEPQSQNLALNS